MAPKPKGGKGKGKAKSKQQTNQKTTATVSASTSGRRVLPHDVIFDILTRLPVKSLLRFRCASKQWRTLVSLPKFISTHLTRSPTALLIHANRVPTTAAGEPEPEKPDGHVIYAYSQYFPSAVRIHDFPGSAANGVLDIVGVTQNGVVCIVQNQFAQNFTLWNPATGSVLNLPEPNVPLHEFIIRVSAGFGFDPTENKYAVIRLVCLRQIPNPLPDVAQIFNFRTGRWVRLDNDDHGTVTFRAATGTCEAVVDGVPYWKGMEHDPHAGPMLKLAWFDVKRSRFNVEWMPSALVYKASRLGEIWPGCLGAIVWEKAEPWPGERSMLEVWARDGEGTGWNRKYRVDRIGLPVVGRLVGFRGDGEMVQEVDGDDEEETPSLFMMQVGGDIEAVLTDVCDLDGAWPGTCSIRNYTESLTKLPRIGSSVI